MNTAVKESLGPVERSLNRARALRLLDELDPNGVTGAMTAYGQPGSTPPADANAPWLEKLLPALGASRTGFALFWSEENALALLPPFPVTQYQLQEGWDTSHIRKVLSRDYLLGVVLLRLGRLAVGVFRGESLVSSKTGSRYVKGRHSAGGTSQKRFQRVREKQVREMFDKTCLVVKQQFDPYLEQLDYVLLGGERHTLGAFRKRCDYMSELGTRVLERVLDVREPGQRVLEGCIDAVWQTRVLRLGREGG